MNAEFPADGFPHIGYNHIWKYLIEDVEFKKQLSVKKIYRKSASIVQQIWKWPGLREKSSSAILFERWISLSDQFCTRKIAI